MRPPASGAPARGEPSTEGWPPAGGSSAARAAARRACCARSASEQAGTPDAHAGKPEPWFGTGAEDAGPAGEQAEARASDGPASGPGPSAGNGALAMAATQPVAQWAWLSIAAMVVPLAALLLVVLV